MGTRLRMTGEERRLEILQAARPLFAMNGFKGTSIREIAKAASVSEALLYKHFKGKEEIYSEMLKYAAGVGSNMIDELQDIEPGAEKLITIVYLMFRSILFEVAGRREEQLLHERFLFHSFLETGNYARTAFRSVQEASWETIEESYRAAQEQAHLVEMPIPFVHRSWFVHHLAMALNLCHLPEPPAFEYQGSLEALTEHATLFALRGVGLTDAAIRRYYHPEKLRTFKESFYRKELNG